MSPGTDSNSVKYLYLNQVTNVDMSTIFHIKFVSLFTNSIHIKYHIPSARGLISFW